MGSLCRIVILISAVSCSFSRGSLISCKQSCNVDDALDCQVKHVGSTCPFTASTSSPEWPGKPENLSLNQIPSGNAYQNKAGFNVSWRMPNNESALLMTGFQVTLYLQTEKYGVLTYCFVISFNTSQIEFSQLVRTMFSMECYVTSQSEGVKAELYGLPRETRTAKQVTASIYFNTETFPDPNNPCSDDPGISATMTEDVRTQLVVTLRTYQNNSQYKIMLLQGSYLKDSQIIQPDNQAGRWKAVFEDSTLLRPGQCFFIKALLTTCDDRSGSAWIPNQTRFCTPNTTTTTSTALMDEVKPRGMERQTGEAEEAIPTSTIIIISTFSILGIILLGAVAVFFMRKTRSCSDHTEMYEYESVSVHTRFTNESLNNEDVHNEGSPPQEPEEVKHLVVVYDIGNGKSIRKFIEYLKKICPALHIYDFVDVDAVEEDFGGWFLKVSGKAVSDGGRLLIVYSDGLMKLMEAATEQMYYPGYKEKVHSGEHMSSFLSLMQNRLFFRNNPRVIEWAISLGEDFHPDFRKVLVHFSGVKLDLFEWRDKQLSIHERSTTDFLKMLQVNDVDIALADPLLTDVLTTTQEVLISQTEPDWFIKLYGNREQIPSRGEEDPATDWRSVDSSSTGSDFSSQSDERSNSFSMEELPSGLDMSSDRCPDHVEVIPPEFLHEEDSGV